MTKSRLFFLLICCGFLISSIKIANCQEEEDRVFEYAGENEQCLKCHKQSHYIYYNEELGDSIKEFMCEQRRIDSSKFYNSVHGTFSCFDCHSIDYTEFPHPGILRLEEQWNCIDCHGYDEEFARFHFEEIQEEYDKSVHANLTEDFSCWSCHNPHTYKLFAREDDNIRNVVAYDNNICLSCHSDYDRFQLLTEREEINLIDKHDWLPRQELHFQSVRCIECHAVMQDTILVAHQIKPSKEAVNNCVECHSENSILLASLYKYQVKEQRNQYGFLNAPLVEDFYVIGATRNFYLNVASVVIFGILLIIITVHAVKRKKSKKNIPDNE